MSSRYVTPEFSVPDEDARYRLYRLCECAACDGRGKTDGLETYIVPPADHMVHVFGPSVRCKECRGEGRVRDLVATATDPESLGVALVTLAREGEFTDCPIGILDTEGAKGQKWLVRPWQPSTRNVSDAARVLAKSKKEKT